MPSPKSSCQTLRPSGHWGHGCQQDLSLLYSGVFWFDPLGLFGLSINPSCNHFFLDSHGIVFFANAVFDRISWFTVFFVSHCSPSSLSLHPECSPVDSSLFTPIDRTAPMSGQLATTLSPQSPPCFPPPHPPPPDNLYPPLCVQAPYLQGRAGVGLFCCFAVFCFADEKHPWCVFVVFVVVFCLSPLFWLFHFSRNGGFSSYASMRFRLELYYHFANQSFTLSCKTPCF